MGEREHERPSHPSHLDKIPSPAPSPPFSPKPSPTLTTPPQRPRRQLRTTREIGQEHAQTDVTFALLSSCLLHQLSAHCFFFCCGASKQARQHQAARLGGSPQNVASQHGSCRLTPSDWRQKRSAHKAPTTNRPTHNGSWIGSLVNQATRVACCFWSSPFFSLRKQDLTGGALCSAV